MLLGHGKHEAAAHSSYVAMLLLCMLASLSECDGFLALDESSSSAAWWCLERHEHDDDHYGDGEAPGPAADESRFQLREGEIDLLTRRDIDISHGWPPHVGRYLSR